MTAELLGGEVLPAERLMKRAAPAVAVDPTKLERALRAAVRGEVRFDSGSRGMYAHDASNYRRVPIAVVVPETNDDVVAAVAVCRAFGVPVVSRGGGTSLAGQTVNEAVVLDFSKKLNRVIRVDPEARRARVELGLVCDDLVARVKPFGITWGPKPATHSRCCFGGMLANNCGGMHAQMNGTAVDNVEELDVLLYDGTRMRLGWMDERALRDRAARHDREGLILSRLRSLRERYADRIRAGYPQIPRRVSGYNLDQLLPGPDGRFNLARVVVGSEGTLVTMLEAEIELLDDPPFHAVVVLGYPDVFIAADAVPSFLDLRPLALEGVDELLCNHIRKKGGEHAKHLDLLPGGRGWLCLELGAAREDELREVVQRALERGGSAVVDSRVYLDPAAQAALWDAREGGLGATAFVPGEPDAWPGWEDSAVAPERLGAYLRDLRRLFDAYGYHPALYGHFGMGLVHCRVPFDLYDEHGVRHFREFMSDAADLVVSYGGSLSGEHGDGQARAELLVKMFGTELIGAMRELKSIFDPDGMMNPGKIVDPYPIVDHLNVYPPVTSHDLDTHFRYVEDGGSFARAALRCVGIGKCRREHGKGDHDVMCPSYMVTHEERHSTRGRAHLLFEMVRGDGPVADGWRDESVKEALDLCLACKGCKSDCPVNVDMATYKAEFFSHYYEGRVRPRHAYAFGLIDRWAKLAEAAPGLANLVTQTPGLSAVAKAVAGVAQDAKIPAFAPVTFRRMFRERAAPERPRREAGRTRVVLFADTFNDHFHPGTLLSALRVLEHVGCEVVLPAERVCCGRPLYDFGMLDGARRHLERLLSVLAPEIAAGTPVVVLEPSCASVLKDEMPDLLAGRDDARALRDRTMLLGEFLVKSGKQHGIPPLPRRKAIVQGHCHHKSVLDFESERAALEATGLDFEVLESGCCGMAGAFGFVSDTRPVGHAAGERVLLPRVRSERTDTVIVANGFSCREQIAQYTDRTGLHLAEVLDLALQEDPLPFGVRPEAAFERSRRQAVRASMARAALGVASGLAMAWWLRRRVRRARARP